MTIEAEADNRRKAAAEWFARLNQRSVTTSDVRAFSEWRRDPENARVFARLESLWAAAETLAETPEVAAFTAEARARLEPAATARRPVRARRLIPIGVTGLATLAMAAAAWIWIDQRPTILETAVGEQRSVELEDGSRVILDTGSRLEVRYSNARRDVTLTQGQAMFEVEGDPARPFLVQAGDTRVTAIGTRFDVRRTGQGARVILVEGRVAVQQGRTDAGRWSLAPGQEITTARPQPEVRSANVPAATSWTTGRLTFENTPIAVAVAEINRYSRTPVTLDDARISSIRVSGVFDTGDVEGFVSALSDLYALKATRTPDGRLVLSAA